MMSLSCCYESLWVISCKPTFVMDATASDACRLQQLVYPGVFIWLKHVPAVTAASPSPISSWQRERDPRDRLQLNPIAVILRSGGTLSFACGFDSN